MITKPGTRQSKTTAAHEGLLSVDAVCEQLGITPHTFYAYRKRYPKFRTVSVGGRTYMRRETLDAFLKDLELTQA